MARASKLTALSMKNPIVKYGIYGIGAYYAYCWLTGKPMNIPFVNNAPLPEPNVSAYPSYWLP